MVTVRMDHVSVAQVSCCHCRSHHRHHGYCDHFLIVVIIVVVIICPIAIAYSMGQIIKSFCVCQCVSVSVRLRALSRSHFLIDFHQN